MLERTPYHADRSTFSREALTRLILRDEAAGIVRAGTALVNLAQKLLVSAVIYERAWGDVGRNRQLPRHERGRHRSAVQRSPRL